MSAKPDEVDLPAEDWFHPGGRQPAPARAEAANAMVPFCRKSFRFMETDLILLGEITKSADPLSIEVTNQFENFEEPTLPSALIVLEAVSNKLGSEQINIDILILARCMLAKVTPWYL